MMHICRSVDILDPRPLVRQSEASPESTETSPGDVIVAYYRGTQNSTFRLRGIGVGSME